MITFQTNQHNFLDAGKRSFCQFQQMRMKSKLLAELEFKGSSVTTLPPLPKSEEIAGHRPKSTHSQTKVHPRPRGSNIH